MKGYFKLGEDALIGNQYWDFLGGKNTYESILGIFDDVGKMYKKDISNKIKEVANTKILF